ncbi:MAG: hypothetical protein HY700_22285 [Gemmatimonadetes bacterium]|nr:hypothetical protein [Gemmatimonadota bacterium]
MTSPKLLLPLRVPELGPSLGKLVTGTGRDPGGLSLASIRYQLVTKMIESAGEARRLAGNDERSAAIFALSPVFWLTAWEETVNAVAAALIERVSGSITCEAEVVRMPARLRAKLLPSATERRALTARLGSAGAGLVPALDELERRGAAALTATAMERAALEAWHDALRTAARRLEAAWLALEDRAELELARWDPVIQRAAKWRKSLTPVWIASVAALAVAAWLGLTLGGFIPAPAVMQPLLRQ